MNYGVWDAYEAHLDWPKKRWIPVAGDGCGNDYVMLVTPTNCLFPVVFVDNSIGSSEPAYVVASGLFPFLEFFLEEGLTNDRFWWPFDKERLLTNDPNISRISGLVFPWEVV